MAVLQAAELRLHMHPTNLLTAGTCGFDLDNTKGRTMRVADKAAIAVALPEGS